MKEHFTMLIKSKGSFTMLNKSKGKASVLVNKVGSFTFLGNARGARGEKGIGADTLEPRITALESNSTKLITNDW